MFKEDIMARTSTLVLSALIAGGIFAGHADAFDRAASLHGSQLGTPVPAAAGRTVQINGSTKYINVEHFEILTMRDEKGQTFTWQFDTFYPRAHFPLKRIAPAGFHSGNAWTYVERRLPSD